MQSPDESRAEEAEEVDGEDSWVLDSLVGFLRGPVWGLSVEQFVDTKSVVFEPEEEEEPEVTRQEYSRLYAEYKGLVDRLLSSHMSDLGISAEQFDAAVRRVDGLLASKFRRTLFEQIWAANDFEIFVRFMTQKNIELQLQALQVLAQRFGSVYESFVPMGAKSDDYFSDESVVREAIRRSLQEDDDSSAAESKPWPSVASAEASAVEAQRQRLESERQREEQRLQEAIQSALSLPDDDNDEEREAKDEEETRTKSRLLEETAVKATTVKATAEPSSGGLSAEEMRLRSDYLRSQRDRLLALKGRERGQQMARIEAQEVSAKRPKSARAMRSVTFGATERQEDNDDDQQSLAFRRSLAARLKAEVVEKQHKV